MESDSWTDARRPTLNFFDFSTVTIDSAEYSDRVKRQQAMTNIAAELNVTG